VSEITKEIQIFQTADEAQKREMEQNMKQGLVVKQQEIRELREKLTKVNERIVDLSKLDNLRASYEAKIQGMERELHFASQALSHTIPR